MTYNIAFFNKSVNTLDLKDFSTIWMLYEKLDDLLDQAFWKIVAESHSKNPKDYVSNNEYSSYLNQKLWTSKQIKSS